MLDLLGGLSYVDAVLWLGARLADGLAHAHDHGVVHRDLKPANVLLTDDGQPMLLDFNLSADAQPAGLVEAARVGGTLPYMSPEHLESYAGQPRVVDGRSDLYSLGVILFELLTGRHPFPVYGKATAEQLRRMVADRQSVPRLRDRNPAITPAVESIVRKCLDPDPGKRYPSAHALQEDLERQLSDQPLRHARDPDPRERLRKWARRHPRLSSGFTLGTAAAVLVGVAVGVAVNQRDRRLGLEARENRQETWAAVANINLALVSDQGVAFGTAGPLQGDPRHGDIRLGATNLGAMEIAATTPFDLFGGWSGAVLLNTARSFNLGGTGGAVDVYTTLLQEAGHAFGIGNSLDPASAMYEQYRGPRTGLSPGDVADIRTLYGARTPDRFEGWRGNNTLGNATPLPAGTTVDADLTTASDVDVYRVAAPAGGGSLTLRLTTSGISLLTARLTVVDAAGRVVGSAIATDPTAGDLTVTLNAARGATYFVRVKAARKDVFGIGACRLAAGAPATGAPLIHGRAGASAGFGRSNGIVPLGAQRTPDQRWDFTYRAGLSDSRDTDTYVARTRRDAPGVMVAAVWGLTPGGLAPVVTVRDQSGRVVPAKVLTDGAGVETIQVRDVRPLTAYRIMVAAADPHDSTSRGDYFLGVDFRDQPISPQPVAAGTLTAAQPDVSAVMTVTQSELLHFALVTVTADASVESAVRLSVRDQSGRELFTLFATAGQAASGDVLLPAGHYTLIVTGGTRLPAATLPDLSFTLSGLVRNDPIGIGPVDPSGDPTSPPTPPPPDTTGTTPYTGPYTGPYRPA